MEDNNLLLNIISEPTPTKSKLIGKKSIVCLIIFFYLKEKKREFYFL
jgi:hypothetical protein